MLIQSSIFSKRGWEGWERRFPLSTVWTNTHPTIPSSIPLTLSKFLKAALPSFWFSGIPRCPCGLSLMYYCSHHQEQFEKNDHTRTCSFWNSKPLCLSISPKLSILRIFFKAICDWYLPLDVYLLWFSLPNAWGTDQWVSRLNMIGITFFSLIFQTSWVILGHTALAWNRILALYTETPPELTCVRSVTFPPVKPSSYHMAIWPWGFVACKTSRWNPWPC